MPMDSTSDVFKFLSLPFQVSREHGVQVTRIELFLQALSQFNQLWELAFEFR